jgi:hypothetical protein
MKGLRELFSLIVALTCVVNWATGQDLPVAPVVNASSLLAGPGDSCQGCQNNQGCPSCQWLGRDGGSDDGGESQGLFNRIPFLAEHGLKLNGLVMHGYTENAANPTNPPPPGFGNWPGQGFPYRSDEYMFNRVMLMLDREVTTDNCGWSIGGHIDALYGTDYFSIQSRGLEAERDYTNKWNGEDGVGIGGRALQGLALPRLYMDVAYSHVRVRMGKFLHPMGYERFDPTYNQLGYSNTYTLFYGEFRPVTGMMTDVKLADQWTALGGFHRGNGNWEDNNDRLNGFGGFVWKSSDKTASFHFVFDVGAEDEMGKNDQYKHSFVVQKTWADTVTYILHNHYGNVEANAPTLELREQPGTWGSFVQYLLYKFNDKSGVGIRYELFDDKDGTRVFPRVGVPFPAPGIYHEIGAAVLYKPVPSLWLRVGVRWDWFDPDNPNSAPGPWDDGTRRSQFTSSVSAVHLF